MTIKERLVELIREEGCDFVTACKAADHAIRETKAERKSCIWHIGGTTFTLQYKGD